MSPFATQEWFLSCVDLLKDDDKMKSLSLTGFVLVVAACLSMGCMIHRLKVAADRPAHAEPQSGIERARAYGEAATAQRSVQEKAAWDVSLQFLDGARVNRSGMVRALRTSNGPGAPFNPASRNSDSPWG